MKIVFLILAVVSQGALVAEELSLFDVKERAEEIFSHHLYHRELTPLLLQKSYKIFLSEFDPDGLYLLEEEAELYLSVEKAKETFLGFEKKKPLLYADLQSLFSKSVKRARRLRSHLRNELVAEGSLDLNFKNSFFTPFPKDAEEQQKRIKSAMEHWLVHYAKERGKTSLDSEERFLVLQFHEKKRREHEEKFLGGAFGKKKASIGRELLKAITTSLDKDSRVYEQEEGSLLKEDLQKKFCGLGITLQEAPEGVKIVKVLANSPAERSDLRKDDILLAIDKDKLSSLSFREALKKLRGEPQSSVKLLIERPQSGALQFVVAREELVPEDRIKLTYEPFSDGLLGVVSISSFYEGVFQELQEFLKKLKKQGRIYGLILDLRHNRGGFLDEVLKSQTLFTKETLLAQGLYREGSFSFVQTQLADAFYDMPLLVLTSRYTAAGGELFAKSLQEKGVALVMGDDRTSGQGLIQHQTITEGDFPYQVTIGELLSPKGEYISCKGVSSDIVVPTTFCNIAVKEKSLFYPEPPLPKKSLVCLPTVSSKTSLTGMLKQLIRNSELRRQEDKNFKAFMRLKEGKALDPEESLGYGEEDLSLKEARNILKDIAVLRYFKDKLVKE